jgi:signal recognition particle receptor subunit beta
VLSLLTSSTWVDIVTAVPSYQYVIACNKQDMFTEIDRDAVFSLCHRSLDVREILVWSDWNG